MVLDLAALEFMDASGLRVMARAARRLNPAAGELAIRSPSRMVRRMLDLTGLAAGVHLEQPEPAQGHLGREQAVEAETAPDGLAHRLGTATALPADNDVIAGALRMVVALARATVGGADGVSVSLRRHGRLTMGEHVLPGQRGSEEGLIERIGDASLGREGGVVA